MSHKPKPKSNSIASKIAKDKAKAKLVHKKKPLVKKPKPKVATPKPKPLTLAMIREQNLAVGQCFSKSHHPERSFQTKVHQGNGGVFFVFTAKDETGAQVREFYPTGSNAGHTSYSTDRHFPSVKEAHAAAAKLAKG